MSVIAKGGASTNFPLCPTGQHSAICVDVIDLGEQETPFLVEKGPKAGQKKVQHQVQIVWQVAPEDEDGEIILREDGTMHRLSKYYTLSLNEMANLRKDLDRWRGQAFTDEELASGWDLENVLGARAMLVVKHRVTKKGDDRAEVDTVLPHGRRDLTFEPEEYQREKDRPGGRDMRSPPAEDNGRGQQKAQRFTRQEEDDFVQSLPF